MTYRPQTSPLLNFQLEAERRGLKLLHDDLVHIRKMLPKIPHSERHGVLKRYLHLWTSMLAECENETSAQNFGRATANRYLLEL